MKTKKILMLMAAMLLSCASAFAQSGNNTPAKGDVNEDGTVDVADIVNVIKIMKDGGGAVGEKMCYWYAGTNNGNAVQADNLTDVASRIPESEVPATGSVTANGQYVYFVIPETKHVESLTDGNGSAVEFTCTDVMGYHIYKTNDKISGSVNYNVVQTVYYWYVGQTDPSTMTSIAPIVTDTTSPGWRLIGNTLPTYSSSNMLWDGVTNNISFGNRDYSYIAVPYQPLQMYDSAGDDGMFYTIQNNGNPITIAHIQYYIYKSDYKTRAFGMNIYNK